MHKTVVLNAVGLTPSLIGEATPTDQGFINITVRRDWVCKAVQRVMARGVDTALYSPARRSESLRQQWGQGEQDLAVLYVGRLAAEKNLRVVVDAFNALAIRRPDAKLIFVGDGPPGCGHKVL